MNSKRYLIWFLAATTAFLLGFFAYSAYINNYAYQQSLAQLRTVYVVLGTTGSALYGSVTAVDIAQGILTVSGPDPFSGNATPRLWSMAVIPQTLILHQSAVRDTGVITGLSSTTAASMSAIEPGTRVKIFYDWQSGQLTARIVLFGDPL